MTHQDTIPIIFNGGSYGTYLEYVLNTWTDQGEQLNQSVLPFTEKNNAHGYHGHHVMNLAGWREYINQTTVHKFVRLHPKTLVSETHHDTVLEILSVAQRAIYIEIDELNTINVLNNYFSKIWNNWHEVQFEQYIDINLIYNNWPVAVGTPIADIPVWILREFLSYYLIPSWRDQTQCPRLDLDRLTLVTVNELLYNFKETIDRICSECGLTCSHDLSSIHTKMLSAQEFLNQGQLCHSIITAFVHGADFDYSNQLLTLVDEIWIQWYLRQLGWEIKCHGLDVFPRTVAQLRNCSFRL